jgi:hypothetical protein
MGRLVMGLLTGALALLGGGCGTSLSSFRYRMTVDGSHSGTAVYEMLAEKVRGPLLPEEKPGGSIIKGEALVIETPSGPVFVLLKSAAGGGDLEGAVVRALAPDIPWNGQPNFWKAVNRLSGAGNGDAKGDLPRADWPMMVRFRDLNDPKSVEQVDPDTIGVKRIALETTSDPVTVGIEKRLGWLPTLKGGYLNGATTARNAGLGLAAGNFSTEIGK